MFKFLKTAASNAWQGVKQVAGKVAAAVVGFAAAGANAADAFTPADSAPSVTTMANTVTQIAYGALVVAVAIVGVKLGIRFVKWIRG